MLLNRRKLLGIVISLSPYMPPKDIILFGEVTLIQINSHCFKEVTFKKIILILVECLLQEKSPYVRERSHDREGRDKQYPF